MSEARNSRDEALIEAGFTAAVMIGGSPFLNAWFTSCVRCGAMVLLGQIETTDDGKAIEAHATAHLAWHDEETR